MNYADPELRDRLAAGYALGTLRGRARKRFERLLAEDSRLAELTEDWELRLNLLAEIGTGDRAADAHVEQYRPGDLAGPYPRARRMAQPTVG